MNSSRFTFSPVKAVLVHLMNSTEGGENSSTPFAFDDFGAGLGMGDAEGLAAIVDDLTIAAAAGLGAGKGEAALLVVPTVVHPDLATAACAAYLPSALLSFDSELSATRLTEAFAAKSAYPRLGPAARPAAICVAFA